VVFRHLLTVGVIAFLMFGGPTAKPAEAAITFSFSDLEMSNGALDVFASGSVTIAEMSDAPQPTISAGWKPVDAIDVDVSLDGTVVRSFQDASYFIYSDGTGVDGTNYLSIYPSLKGGVLDPLFDQLYLTFHQGLVYGLFSTISYGPGFLNVQAPSYTESVTESVPEPSTWAMMLLGFGGLGFAGWRAKRKSAALPA
jgi:hypothetical protein